MKRRSSSRRQSRTEMQEYLVSLIGNAPYGVLAIDIDGIITIANANAATCLQREGSVKALIDQPILEVVADMPPLEYELRRCLTTGRQPFDVESFAYRNHFLTAKGRTILNGMMLTLEDITERIENRQRLEQQRKALEKSNRELEEFAYISSHDMKSPIASLHGLIALMHKHDAVKPEHHHLFDMVTRSTDRLQQTVLALNEVIAFRKTLTLPPETVVVEHVLRDVQASIVDLLTASKATIHTHLADYPRVQLPQIHLRSIIQNLLTNAIKYRHPQRPLIIDIASGKDQWGLFFQITDNGRGIDLERFKGKVFGLFQRFHPEIAGMGIGLHMVHSIIESYGGKIALESTPDEGTRFRIYWGKHYA